MILNAVDVNDLTAATLTGDVFVTSDGTTIRIIDHHGKTVTTGDAGVDDSTYILGAVEAVSDGGTVKLNGSFVCTTQIAITKSVHIIGEPGAKITYNTPGSPLFYGSAATVSSAVSLAANANARASSITVSDASGVSADQLILIYDNAIWNPTNYATWKTGELHKVKSVSGNVITLVDTLVNAYTTANSAACKVASAPTVVFRDIVLESTNSTASGRGISLYFCKDSKIENCMITGFGLYAINLDECYNTTISHCTISKCEYSGYGYGICINDACAFIDIHANHIHSCRHCITHGGYGEIGQIRESLVRGNSLTGVADLAVLDAHPVVESIIVSNNTIITPNTYDPNAYIGSKHAIITGNRFVGGSLTPRGNITGCNWVISNNLLLNSGYGFKANSTGYTWAKVSFIGNIAVGGTLITVSDPAPITTLVQL